MIYDVSYIPTIPSSEIVTQSSRLTVFWHNIMKSLSESHG